MNKKILLAIISIIFIISAALIYVLLVPSQEATKESVDKYRKQTTPSSENVSQTDSNKPGVYRDYSQEVVASTAGTKLLFFHAPWCPQCREIEASIKTGGIPSGVTVFKVDYDSNQSLRQKYGVTIQTTFVKIDDKGNKIASYTAYEEPRFSSVQRELLP